MKRSVNLFLRVSLLVIFAPTYGQDRPQTTGTCTGYEVEGNRITFTTDVGAGLSISVLGEDVLKIWYAPDGVFERKNPSFAVVNETVGDPIAIQVDEQQSLYEFYTNTLRIRVTKASFGIQVYDKYQRLLLSDYQDQGHVEQDGVLVSRKVLRSDEHIIGLGEKNGPIDRKGKQFKMWNSDVPCYLPDTDPLYKSIPFFMSSYNYGIFFDNTYKTEFKFGTESSNHYSFEAPGGEMIYYFIHGSHYKDILRGYIALTGKAIMPPKWALGFSQSRGLLTSEKLSREIAEGYRSRAIPCDVIFQDIGWSSKLMDFEWSHRYDDAKKMLADLKSQGFKVIVSQDPVISQNNTKQWEEADKLGYFTIDERTGKTYDMPWPWGGNCGVVDFTKPEVADWWGVYQQKPIADGVSGYWTDMGEPAWSNEDAEDRLHMRHHLGMHDEMHNVYGLVWDKVVTEQFEKHNPNTRIFQLTRAAYAGLQRYTFGWSGDAGNGNDVLQGWEQLAAQVPLAQSAGLGLIPFWATDISGYCGDIHDYPAMAELYVRWLQFGAFNPISRIHHEGDNAVEPWLFGEEAEAISRKAIELKYQLLPYIYTYARQAYDLGLPLIRAMALEYPNDRNTYEAGEQFMFGEYLLVAPVVEQGALEKEVYLPKGEWIDFNDKKTSYRGGKWVTVDAPLCVTPVFVKKGSIIPMSPVVQYVGEKADMPLILEVFPAGKGQSATFELYEDDGETNDYKKDIYTMTSFDCQTTTEGWTIQVAKLSASEGGLSGSGYIFHLHVDAKPNEVMLNGKNINYSPKALSDIAANETGLSVWNWDEEAGICKVFLQAQNQLEDLAIEVLIK